MIMTVVIVIMAIVWMAIMRVTVMIMGMMVLTIGRSVCTSQWCHGRGLV